MNWVAAYGNILTICAPFPLYKAMNVSFSTIVFRPEKTPAIELFKCDTWDKSKIILSFAKQKEKKLFCVCVIKSILKSFYHHYPTVTPEIEARERSKTCIYGLSQTGICIHWLLKQKAHDRKPYLGFITIMTNWNNHLSTISFGVFDSSNLLLLLISNSLTFNHQHGTSLLMPDQIFWERKN